MRRLGLIRPSGVLAVAGAAAACGVGGSAKDNLVCRTTFVSVSFAVATFGCFVLFPRLGDRLLPLAPLGLRLFLVCVMVGFSRSCGTKGCVKVVAVLCRIRVGYLLLCRFVLFIDLLILDVIVASLTR